MAQKDVLLDIVNQKTARLLRRQQEDRAGLGWEFRGRRESCFLGFCRRRGRLQRREQSLELQGGASLDVGGQQGVPVARAVRRQLKPPKQEIV